MENEINHEKNNNEIIFKEIIVQTEEEKEIENIEIDNFNFFTFIFFNMENKNIETYYHHLTLIPKLIKEPLLGNNIVYKFDNINIYTTYSQNMEQEEVENLCTKEKYSYEIETILNQFK